MRERVAIVVKRKGNWKKKSVVCFGSVKFVRPFCNLIVALLAGLCIITEVIQELKSIFDAVLRNGEVMIDGAGHVLLP